MQWQVTAAASEPWLLFVPLSLAAPIDTAFVRQAFLAVCDASTPSGACQCVCVLAMHPQAAAHFCRLLHPVPGAGQGSAAGLPPAVEADERPATELDRERQRTFALLQPICSVLLLQRGEPQRLAELLAGGGMAGGQSWGSQLL